MKMLSRIIFSLICVIVLHTQAMEQPKSIEGEQFLEAVKGNDITKVEKYLDAGGNVNYEDDLGNTALHYAFALGGTGQNMMHLLATKRPGLQQLKNKIGQLPPEMAPSDYLASIGYYAWAPVSAASWMTGKLWEYTSGAALWSAEKAVSGAKGVYALGECSVNHIFAASAFWHEISKPDAYSSKSATVSAALSEEEKEYIQQRKIQSNAALETFLGQKIDMKLLPSVGFCFSGGGYRAMLEALGWLSGAKKIGIMDSALYMTALSGSTWAVNPLVASGLSLDEYKEQLLPRLTKTLQEHVNTMKDEDIREILIMLGRKYYKNQSIGPVDIFGALLAHMLLGKHGGAVPKNIVENPYHYPLSLLGPAVKAGKFPLPISTAVLGGVIGEGVRPTLEFSPFTAGSFELNGFVPTWAFGRLFDSGISQRIIPEAPGQPPFYGTELPLGYLMGTFGSAFAVDMYNIMLELLKRLMPEQYCPKDTQSLHSLVTVLKDTTASSFANYAKRISEMIANVPPETEKHLEGYLKNENYGAAWVNNFLYKHAPSSVADRKELALVDGGFSLVEHDRLNIAIMPLLYRRLDVITICDSSWDLKGAPSLRAAERAAQVLKLKFPKINYENIDATIASVFVDEEDLEVPIVIYMPGIANKAYNEGFNPITSEFTGTFNFTYTPEQAQLLMGLLEFNVQKSENILRAAFKKAVERKKRLAEKQAGWLGGLGRWWRG